MVVFITGVINENVYGEADVSKKMLIQIGVIQDKKFFRAIPNLKNKDNI